MAVALSPAYAHLDSELRTAQSLRTDYPLHALEALQRLESAWRGLKFTIDQLPFMQGFDAITTLYAAAKYDQPPLSVATGPVIVTSTEKALLGANLVAQTGY